MNRGWISPLLVLWLLAISAWSDTPLPPAPTKYVEDAARVLSPAVRDEIDSRLEAFERETSSQMVVYLSPSLPQGADLEDYVNRLFQAWKIGRRGRDNGVLVAVFTQDHRMRIEAGYGLEGALPDALAGRIIRNEMAPRFKAGDYDDGVRAGVQAIIAATKGEYKSDDRGENRPSFRQISPIWFVVSAALGAIAGFFVRFAISSGGFGRRFAQGMGGGVLGVIGHPIALALGIIHVFAGFTVLAILWRFITFQPGAIYSRGGYSNRWSVGWGSGWSGGWGGGSGGSGGGGFSGGGGRSGGGGASGSW